MKNTVKLYLRLWRNKMKDCMIRQQCKDDNSPMPAMLKRKLVAYYGKKFMCNTLIETGTYLGEMVEYQAKNFEKIYSVEVSEALYDFSSRRLRRKSNINVVKGDSGIVLGSIMKQLLHEDRVLFWLDGHYSGGVTGTGSGGGDNSYL